jgi:hypothetical protein
MRSARSVLLVLMLLAGSLSPPGAGAQEVPRGSPPPERGRGFALEPNTPSPVEGETWIPFTLDATLFETRDTVLVSLRIYNSLGQEMAVALALDHPRGKRAPLRSLPYTEPGRKLAYWNASDATGRKVPSGLYFYELAVGDMRPYTLRMMVYNPQRKRRFFPWFGG